MQFFSFLCLCRYSVIEEQVAWSSVEARITNWKRGYEFSWNKLTYRCTFTRERIPKWLVFDKKVGEFEIEKPQVVHLSLKTHVLGRTECSETSNAVPFKYLIGMESSPMGQQVRWSRSCRHLSIDYSFNYDKKGSVYLIIVVWYNNTFPDTTVVTVFSASLLLLVFVFC